MKKIILPSFFFLLSSSLMAADTPDVKELIRDLKSDKPNVRAHAAAELARRGPDGAEASPALIDALNDDSVAVRHEALVALQRVGPAARGAIPAFQKLLESDHALIRAQAARALGLLGPDAEPAVSDLATALKDKEINVRHEAAAALGEIGPAAHSAVPALIAALSDELTMKIQAAHALARIGEGAVPELTAIIKEKGVGRWAVNILRELGPVAGPALDSLRAALPGANDDLARDIMRTLGCLGPDAAAAAPELIEMLKSKKEILRISAANALGNIRATQAVPQLEELVQDDDENSSLPLVAAGALVLIEGSKGEHFNVALPKLIAALDHKSEIVRREAATALRQIGPAAASAVPSLVHGLQDPNPAVCIDCLWALTAVTPPKQAATLVPEIVGLLSSPNAHVRYTACYAVGSIGPAAVGAAPILEKHLRESDTHLQVTSAWALVRIRPDNRTVAEECIPPLLGGLRMRDPHIRAEAATTLGLLGTLAQPAAKSLAELTQDDDEAVREAVQQALRKIQPAGTKSKLPQRTSSQTQKKAS